MTFVCINISLDRFYQSIIKLINYKTPFEKRIVSYIPHSMHGTEDRCSLSLYCKSEIIEIVCYLASGNKIVTLIKIWKFTFGLPCHLRREYPAIPHSIVIKVDVHSACTASLKWFYDCLLSGWWWWNCHIDQKYEILHLDPRREFSAIPHSMAMKMDIHLACAASLKLIWDGLLSGWLW